MKNPAFRFWRSAPAALLAAVAIGTGTPLLGATRIWTGQGSDNAASTPENWQGAIAPAAGDDIVVGPEGAHKALEWDLDIPVNDWRQEGYSNKVTIATRYGDEGFTELVITGDCHVMDGSWKHRGNDVRQEYCLRASIGGDLTIGPGAMVSGRGLGYGRQYGPGRPRISGDGGAAHGGRGGYHQEVDPPITRAYGSIYAPTTIGSGGSKGGGAVILRIGGRLLLDGTIDVGVTPGFANGSAGSINVTAQSIAGTGGMLASAGDNNNNRGGAAGRVAVTLTGPESTFDTFSGSIEAFSSTAAGPSGCGTIYLREKGQPVDEGTLILDAGITDPRFEGLCAMTPIGGPIEGTAFGKVILRNHARAMLLDGSTMSLSGDFDNGGVFLAGRSSTVRFTGSAPATITGDTTFENLSCSAPGKVLSFAGGSRQTIRGLLDLDCPDGAPVVLRSTVPGSAWSLTANHAKARNVSVADCSAAAGAAIDVFGGLDGGSNTNWNFVATAPGEEITWTGAVDANWNNGENWSPARVPFSIDTARIPGGTAFPPVADSALALAALHVEQGGALSLGGHDLSVSGSMTILGTLTATNGETIVLGGDLSIASADLRDETFILSGSEEQALFLPDESLGRVVVRNETGVRFSNSFSVRSLTCGDGRMPCVLTFSPGTRATIRELRLSGDKETANIRLQSATPGQCWELDAGVYDISAVRVSDCDASAGETIYPSASSDGGGNLNWDFSDLRKRWTGATDGDFANPGNWADGAVPSAGDAILIGSGSPAVLSDSREIGPLTIGPGGDLKITTNITVRGSVTIEARGKLTWDKASSIDGDLILRDGALLTHSRNGSDEAHRIDLRIAGDGFVAANARIDAKGKGYRYQRGPGYRQNTATHGGRAAMGTVAALCYGSIVTPTNCGSGGAWTVTSGGGAIALRFGGHLELLGSIAANGNDEKSNPSYYGAGGSVLLETGSIHGSGTISANGGDRIEGGGSLGGGGRIAVKLTAPGADFDDFTGALEAYGSRHDIYLLGSPGTVYTETAAQRGGRGRVLVDGTLHMNLKKQDRFTDFPSASLCVEDETKRTTVFLRGQCRLNLTADTTVEDITLEGEDPILRLNGHILTVRCKKHPLGKDEELQVTYDDGGQIIWIPHGGATLLLLR